MERGAGGEKKKKSGKESSPKRSFSLEVAINVCHSISE